MEKICLNLGFNNFWIVESRGRAGGMAIMWNDVINIQYVWSNERIIHCEVFDLMGSKLWDLFACYATPYGAKKRVLGGLGRKGFGFENPWMVCGDLNEIVLAGEKVRGKEIWKKRLFLKDFLVNTGGIDLGFNGRKFMLENKKDGLARIKERIDRAVACNLWMELYPDAWVLHLRMEQSDHCPVLIDTKKKISHFHRPFKFLQAWTMDDSCNPIIEKA